LEKITVAIDSLKLGSTVTESAPYDGEISAGKDTIDKKLLWAVLIINFSFFIIEMGFGLFSNSMGLVGDSLDMLCDAFVYGISIYALHGTMQRKKRIAGIVGVLQILLAIFGFSEIVRRFIGVEPVPNFLIMIIVSVFALAANTASIIILNKSRSNEVNIKASQICTSMDIITNTGVIIAGVLVLVLQSKIPDLAVGAVVFAFVLYGAFKILKLAK
jgi:Co/Zn/Cd efflux system component